MAKKARIATAGIVYPKNFIGKYGKHDVVMSHIQVSGIKDVDLSLKMSILDFHKKGDNVDLAFKLGNYTIKLSVEKHG